MTPQAGDNLAQYQSQNSAQRRTEAECQGQPLVRDSTLHPHGGNDSRVAMLRHSISLASPSGTLGREEEEEEEEDSKGTAVSRPSPGGGRSRAQSWPAAGSRSQRVHPRPAVQVADVWEDGGVGIKGLSEDVSRELRGIKDTLSRYAVKYDERQRSLLGALSSHPS